MESSISCKPPPSKKTKKECNQCKVTENVSSDEILGQIWKEFPEDLFEAVIARLPVSKLFSVFVQSIENGTLLYSQTFSEQCSQVQRGYLWFFTVTHENISSGATYNPSKKMASSHHFFLAYEDNRVAGRFSGGLVCFLDIGHWNFFACNPLTQFFKEFPATSVKVWSQVAIGMVINGSSSKAGYNIIWLGCDDEYRVYDSVKNVWSRSGKMPPNIGIISYDVATGAWKLFIIPSPPLLADHALAKYGGRITLVGLLSKNAATCVYVWELQKMTLLWKEVDRMPNIWSLEFYGWHNKMTCLGNKDLLMLSLRSRQMNRLIMYNVFKREWTKVPTCTVPRGWKRQWIACGTVFKRV